ncbi:hypothetical protein APHAL10511_004739 [Amanita phalloides]|nr:hypothetical protein APHAL10511_004739 [Amanita phalloides]
MCHTSAASFLVWSTFSSGLLIFLVYHLWSFDRFRCLRWDSGPHSGAFKRVMTYSYLTSVPLICIYAVGFTVIKYRAGFVFLPGGSGTLKVFPTPYTAWEPAARAAIVPLMLLFSIAWALEIVTHLEELCFWYFLLNSNATRMDWFKTWYFKLWVAGSISAVLCMPILTIFTRSNPHKSEAFLFLVGSSGSLCITLWFLPILWMFPTFLKSLRKEGVDTPTLVRLTKFSELNRIRVFLRFLFVIPFFILGVDGVQSVPVINENMVVTDVLATIAGFGCIASSGITLVIFFPRSIESEIAYRDATRSRKTSRQESTRNSETRSWVESQFSQESFGTHDQPALDGDAYLLTSRQISMNSLNDLGDRDSTTEGPEILPPYSSPLPPLRPNRRKSADIGAGGMGSLNMRSDAHISVNPMILNWTSPIEFGPVANRLTFNRR